jgi:toxin YoeB
MMNKIWIGDSWKDYLYWQDNDRKVLKRINKLIRDIERNGNMHGIGKPEPLQYDLQGFYSRRIDDKNRLVYVVDEAGLNILSCRYHYGG